jgi:hypothetical protein
MATLENCGIDVLVFGPSFFSSRCGITRQLPTAKYTSVNLSFDPMTLLGRVLAEQIGDSYRWSRQRWAASLLKLAKPMRFPTPYSVQCAISRLYPHYCGICSEAVTEVGSREGGAGMSDADAQKRVDDVVNETKEALDRTRQNAMKLSFWMAAALLFSAFAASLAAVEGGQHRDGTWNERRLVPRAWWGRIMPILLWLLGVPIPIIIILVLLLHH